LYERLYRSHAKKWREWGFEGSMWYMMLKMFNRPISTDKLSLSPDLHRPPINLLFSQGSKWRYLILGSASRLDAFSGYPIRMWLPYSALDSDNRNTRDSLTPVLSSSNLLLPEG